MKTILMRSALIIMLPILWASCENRVSKSYEQTDEMVIADSLPNWPELEEGEFQVRDEVFGNTIDLQGINHPVDQYFQVSETQMLIAGNKLILKNINQAKPFMAFHLPGFEFIQAFGQQGRGPQEFIFPSLIPSTDPRFLFYLSDPQHQKLYGVDPDLDIKLLDFKIPTTHSHGSELQIRKLSEGRWASKGPISRSQAIFVHQQEADTVISHQLYDLGFSKTYRNWVAYIGDFGVNPQRNRMVYAYKYFKRVVFIDYENQRTRIVQFNQDGIKDPDIQNILSPETVTHYWGLSAQPDYVYLLYSGRTPIQVSQENRKDTGYIFVEQFDWNGNPIRRFRLDHWGYFCVNPEETHIYMTSTITEQPFLSFQMPALP